MRRALLESRDQQGLKVRPEYRVRQGCRVRLVRKVLPDFKAPRASEGIPVRRVSPVYEALQAPKDTLEPKVTRAFKALLEWMGRQVRKDIRVYRDRPEHKAPRAFKVRPAR